MPELIEIQCSHCKASLKLKSRAPLGKKVQCPKCSQPFVAQERRRAPQPVDDYEDYDPSPAQAPRPKRRPKPRDDYRDIDDFGDPAGFEDDFDDAPRKSGGRAKKPVRKKKSSGGWVKWVLLGCGGALAVTLLGVGIWLGVRMFGSKKLDLAWLPEDANTINVVRIGALWKSNLVQEALESKSKEAADKMKDEWGFGPQDIVSFTQASSSVNGRSIKVLRTSVDLNEDTILKHASDYEKTTISGQTAYRLQGGMMVFFPDKRTAVSGTEDGVTRAIDQGPKPVKREDLNFVDGGAHIISVHFWDNSGQRVSGSVMGMDLGKVRGNFSWSTITSSVKGVHGTKYASAADAADAMEKAEKLRKKMEEEFRNAMKDVKFDESKFKEVKQEVEQHVSASQSGPKRSGDTIRWSGSAKPLTDKGKRFLGTQGAYAVNQYVLNPAQLFSMPFRVNFGGGFQPNVRRNVGGFPRNRGGFRQPVRRNVKIYDVTVGNYRGQQDQAFAIKVGLKGTRGLDDSRTEVNGNRVTVYSYPNQTVDANDIIRKLQGQGFGSVGVNQFRSE